MDPLSLLHAGQLRQAIAALGAELKQNPLDAKRRTFLFELLCFAGEFDRAEKQLDLLGDTNQQTAAGSLLYRSALHAERTRQQMFASGELPTQDTDRPSSRGTLNGVPFVYLNDLDPRIGPHLEIFIAGSYTWIPFEYIDRLKIDRPTRLRDLIWAQARIRTTPSFRLQDLGEVLLPVLSPQSWKSPDELVALGRSTVWQPDERYGEIPLGQKMFATEADEISFLELQTLTWIHTAEEAQIAPA